MILDPIGDLLTRIRNAYLARKRATEVPHSTMKVGILRILKKNGYITWYSIDKTNPAKLVITIDLNNVKQTCYIPTLTRISKPWQRIYIWSKEIKKSRNWKGIYILSTPKWVITWYEARSLSTWWELLCEIF